MKYLPNFSFAFILLTLLHLTAQAQDGANSMKDHSRKEKRQLLKRETELIDSLNFARAKGAIDSKKWMVIARTVNNDSGEQIQVNSTLNGLSFRNGNAGVRLSFAGENFNNKKMGRISVSGQASSYSKTIDKNGALMIRYVVVNKGQDADVIIRLSGNGNRAYVEVSSTMKASRIKFWGELVPFDKNGMR
jgi:hypothetical protein